MKLNEQAGRGSPAASPLGIEKNRVSHLVREQRHELVARELAGRKAFDVSDPFRAKRHAARLA